METLAGRVALVSGASSGIGEAIARALVILGVHVIGIARRENRLRKIGESLRGERGSFHPLYCDLREEVDILNVFNYANYQFGGIDILVNVAGVTWAEPILNGSTAHYREIFETNTLAPTITSREGVKAILRRGNNGHIVNINSVEALKPEYAAPDLSTYQASKIALHAITEGVREEIKKNMYPIKVTGIYPGFVDTAMVIKSGAHPSDFTALPKLKPKYIADCVVFALTAPGNLEVNILNPMPLHGI